MTDYTVTDGAYADAKSLGVLGDVELRVKRMARRSAPITHELGNRRFEDFVLRVSPDKTITQVSIFDF